MHNDRVLIIILDTFIVEFFLIETDGEQVNLVQTKTVRVYAGPGGFSEVDYIIEALGKWGTEIGVNLVKEKVPIVPQSGEQGVEDIFIITSRKVEGLDAITPNVYRSKKHIQKNGALSLLKFLSFKNLLHITFDFDHTSIVRYKESREGVMKVVSEQIPYDPKKCLVDPLFDERIGSLRELGKKTHLQNLFLNSSIEPLFEERGFLGAALEFFVSEYKLSLFKNLKKLDLGSFGLGGFEDNIIIIGGDRSRTLGNVPLQLLSILSALDLKGNFSLYVDGYGLFDFLQKSEEQILSDAVLSQLLLSYWGNILCVNTPKKGMKLDQIVADVEIMDGKSERQMIPMSGRVLAFEFMDHGEIQLSTRKGFTIGTNKNKNLTVKKAEGIFVVDARMRPVSSNLTIENTAEHLESWLKGIGAIHSF